MIGIDQALSLVLEQARPLNTEMAKLRTALGRVAADEIASTIDSPPHDKSLVDGYAVVAADLAAGSARLTVIEEVTAGQVPARTLSCGEATRIMTGAPIPTNADAVVMVERTKISPHDPCCVEINDPDVTAGQHILRQGVCLKTGQVVVKAHDLLGAPQIGLLAELGCQDVSVFRTPRVAVAQTGDELVPVEAIPGPGQIRNSNGPMLEAMIRQAGGCSCDLGIVNDKIESLTACVEQGLEHDVLVLCGGVSVGVHDFVPQVLRELQVDEFFHGVRIRPGKPLWFGVRDQGQRRTLVFGLPGNPVSAFVCFRVFVQPALAQLAGQQIASTTTSRAILGETFHLKGARPTYWPITCQEVRGSMVARPLAWHGSADLHILAQADALAFFPEGDRDYPPDSIVQLLPLHRNQMFRE